MFWDRFFSLCETHNTKPLNVVKTLGISSGCITNWKNGVVPNGETLIKIANYFNVSVDYLLGRTDDINQKPGQSNIKFDDFSYAMYNESRDLSEDDKQRLLTFARMLRETIEKDEHLNDKKQ